MDKKFLIISDKRFGKDTLAEIWSENFEFTFKSSSVLASEIFLYDTLKDKYGYKTPKECFNDRVNHRVEWFNLINDYNKDDKAKLAKEVLKNNTCYVGMRDFDQIDECKRQGLFDLIIWVDASKRLPKEDKSSFNISELDADIIIDNNSTLDKFRERVIRLGKCLGLKEKINLVD